MIEEGNGWKFTSHIEENAFYEDQLVEHMWTGHRAVRRVYSKRLNLDEEASRAVRRQITESAHLEHPGLQRLFFSEEVEGHFCVYGEHMDGSTLETLTRHKTFVKKSEWSAMSLLLVDLLRDFEVLGIGFDHLTLGSLKIRWNVLRVATRYPTGSLAPGRLPESRYFRRLLETPEVGGVYLAEHAFPLEAGLARLKDLLYFMATGQTVTTVEAALAKSQERLQETGTRAISMLGVDSEIELLLLRLHDPSGSKGISTLRELRRALGMMTPGTSKPSVAGGIIAPAPPPTTRPIAPMAPPPAAPSRPEPAKPADAPAARESSPAAERPAAQTPSKGKLEMPGRANIEEDVEEDRSYLYPTSSPAVALPADAGASSPGSGSSSSQRIPSSSGLRPVSGSRLLGAPRAPRRNPLKPLLAVVVVLAVLGAGAYGVMLLLQSGRSNTPPVAAFATPPAQVSVNQPIALDASGSTDAEGDALRYTWTVEGLEVTNYSIRPGNKTAEAVRAELRLFVPGTHTVTLSVFDGTNMSAPVSHTINVGQ